VPFTPEFGEMLTRWPQSLESLEINANTLCSWRQLPHDSVSEGDTGQKLCEDLRIFATQLKVLRICNLVRIREFLRPIWPFSQVEDKDPFLENPKIPFYLQLEVVNISYGSINYKTEWHKDASDINEHEDTIKFRQGISLATARLAYHMPRLKEMVIAQRPMMWAGKHTLEYNVTETGATIKWTSTFDFKPWPRTIEAWTEVTKKHTSHKLKMEILTLPGWQTDGSRPLTPALSF
jgi:hypothetical protein